MRILFESGYYSGRTARHYYFHARGDAGAKWWSTNACGRRGDLYYFSQHAQEFYPSIHGPASSFLASFSLSASPTTWPQLFEWAGVDTNRGRILFHKAQAIVRTLFKGGYYSTCGYYSRKYGKHGSLLLSLQLQAMVKSFPASRDVSWMLPAAKFLLFNAVFTCSSPIQDVQNVVGWSKWVVHMYCLHATWWSLLPQTCMTTPPSSDV